MNGWKSINNGVTTSGLFWLDASRSFSRFAHALDCVVLALLIRLFSRLESRSPFKKSLEEKLSDVKCNVDETA